MKHCLVDCRISEKELNALSKLGIEALSCPRSDRLYDAISSHPDIQLFFLTKNHLIVQNQMDDNIINKLKVLGKIITLSSKALSAKYPHDIILNCFILGDLFIHNLEHTDDRIIDLLPSDIKKINVKQGYSKCSTAIINNNAAITSDTSIAKALHKENIDVLFIPPGDIILEGLNYGFIGGCCGLLDDQNIAFFGSLDRYSYGDEVKNFLRKHNIDYYYLTDSKLTDRGSLFML